MASIYVYTGCLYTADAPRQVYVHPASLLVAVLSHRKLLGLDVYTPRLQVYLKPIAAYYHGVLCDLELERPAGTPSHIEDWLHPRHDLYRA